MPEPLSARPVNISEINFDRREFIEFYNHTDSPVDLTGYTVIDGIDAFLVGTIQPKEYAVIVSNTSYFRQEYGNTPRILSEYEHILKLARLRWNPETEHWAASCACVSPALFRSTTPSNIGRCELFWDSNSFRSFHP